MLPKTTNSHPYVSDMYPLSEISPAADHHRPKNVSSLAWNPFLDIKRRDDMAGLNIHFPYGGVPRHYQKRIIQSYLASISYVDGLVGDILVQVEKKSLWNNTIIVFMSDHGECRPHICVNTSTRIHLS